MTHVFKVKGMTCMSCEAKVQNALMSMDKIMKADVTRNPDKAVVQMEKHIPLAELNAQLKKAGNFSLEEDESESRSHDHISTEVVDQGDKKTFMPLIMIFVYLVGGVLLHQLWRGSWSAMDMMANFMGGFFVVFSWFKIINLRGFAEAYSTYDVVAKRWYGYGFVYPFLELGLGLSYFSGWNPFITNIATLLIMGVSTIGVFQSLMQKRSIQCACLGTIFNLPMTYVTLTEDLVMVVMALAMLVM